MSTEFKYSREWTDAEAFPLLSFTKNWENPDDYPTIETDEMKVRQDMQSLHDEVKNFLNEELIPAVIAEDAMVDAWNAMEDARNENEQVRVANEETRVLAEQERVENEAHREQVTAEAVEAVNSIENMEANYIELSPGTPVYVEKGVNEEGGIVLTFGLSRGTSGVYVGSGEMPEDCNVQVDVTAGPSDTAGLALVENGILYAETTGEPSAYEVFLNGFQFKDGASLGIKLHVDSGATPTLNVNGTGAKPLMTTLTKALSTTKKGTWVFLTYYADHDFFVSKGSGAESKKRRSTWQKMLTNTYGVKGW